MPVSPHTRRCAFIKFNGEKCGSPALKTGPRCHYHAEIVRRRNLLKPQFIDNAADVQVAVIDTLAALLDRRMDRSNATVVLYGLQIAQNNLKISGFRAGVDKARQSVSVVNQVLEGLQVAHDLESDCEYNYYADVEAALEEAGRAAKSMPPQSVKA